MCDCHKLSFLRKKKKAISAKCNEMGYACVDGEAGSQDHTAGECSIWDWPVASWPWACVVKLSFTPGLGRFHVLWSN